MLDVDLYEQCRLVLLLQLRPTNIPTVDLQAAHLGAPRPFPSTDAALSLAVLSQDCVRPERALVTCLVKTMDRCMALMQ